MFESNFFSYWYSDLDKKMTIYRHISSFADLLMLKPPRAIHQFLHSKPFPWYTCKKFAFLCAFCSPLSFSEMISLYQFYTYTYTLHFSFIFLVLFTERASPQLAKANLGGPCLNKQITKIYRQKIINKKKKFSIR